MLAERLPSKGTSSRPLGTCKVSIDLLATLLRDALEFVSLTNGSLDKAVLAVASKLSLLLVEEELAMPLLAVLLLCPSSEVKECVVLVELPPKIDERLVYLEVEADRVNG